MIVSKIATALTIAGTDPTGGAGIQADLKTFQELKTYGMSVITSVVAQNTTGVQDVFHLDEADIDKQLKSVFDDVPVNAVKTGMIANINMMQVVYRYLKQLNAPYIIDPVMVATSGDPLIEEDARLFLRDKLFPLATVVTPNIPEAKHITGMNIKTENDMEEAALLIVKKYGAKAALVKGGHLTGEAVDILYDGEKFYRFTSQRIHTKNTHGTGCTLSAAITAFMAQGDSLVDAVGKAKKYITFAIKHSISIGYGSGPTNHWAPRIDEEANALLSKGTDV